VSRVWNETVPGTVGQQVQLRKDRKADAHIIAYDQGIFNSITTEDFDQDWTGERHICSAAIAIFDYPLPANG
jgi:hypothetical protein